MRYLQGALALAVAGAVCWSLWAFGTWADRQPASTTLKASACAHGLIPKWRCPGT